MHFINVRTNYNNKYDRKIFVYCDPSTSSIHILYNFPILIFDKNTRTLRIVWDFSQAKIKMITLCAHTHEKSHFILFFNKVNYEFQDRMLKLHIYFYIAPFYF